MVKKYFFSAFLWTLFISFFLHVGAVETLHIETPQSLTAQQKTDDAGNAVVLLEFVAPKSVKLLGEKSWDTGSELFYDIECRVENRDWQHIGSVHFSQGEQILIDDSENSMELKRYLYSFRVRFGYYTVHDDNSVTSKHSLYSNVVHIGNEAAFGSYQNASSWAVEELDRALRYGLVTDKIRNNMKSAITREELCELIMAFYENLAGDVAVEDTGVFTDTNNTEVNKAFKLGIVNGVGDNRFDPDALTNREQVATMIFRAVKALQPNMDFSSGEVESFTDEKEISSWALESVQFMNKTGLLKGSNGKMDPKGVTTREQAALIAVRAYEMFIMQASDTDTDSDASEGIDEMKSIFVGQWSTHDNIGDMVNPNTGAFVSSEFYLIGLSLNEDNSFIRIFISSMGMSKNTGNYKIIEGNTEWENGKILLLYNQKHEFYDPNATIPKESMEKENEEHEIRYNEEDDTLTIDYIGFNTLKRLK